MTFTEKLQSIQEKHFGEWLKTRQTVEQEMSDKQSTFCLCGRLATGLHEGMCRKFAAAVTKETVRRMENLILIKA